MTLTTNNIKQETISGEATAPADPAMRVVLKGQVGSLPLEDKSSGTS